MRGLARPMGPVVPRILRKLSASSAHACAQDVPAQMIGGRQGREEGREVGREGIEEGREEGVEKR